MISDRHLGCAGCLHAAALGVLSATAHSRPHIVWWESEHESHPTAVDARHRSRCRDAVSCAVRVKLFAEFRVSVLRRSSVSAAEVRLVRLWGSTRPHNGLLAIPAGAASRVTSPPPARDRRPFDRGATRGQCRHGRTATPFPRALLCRPGRQRAGARVHLFAGGRGPAGEGAHEGRTAMDRHQRRAAAD
jgi:hypothetical protein